MKMLSIMLCLMTALWSGEYRVVSEQSNAYYRAGTSLLLVGSDEIVGINPALEGWIADGYDGGEIMLDAMRFDSENATRDDHIREILDVEHNPVIRFSVKALEGIDEGRSGSGTLHGVLMVRDVGKTVAFPLQWKRDADALMLQGKTSVSYADFNITPPSLGWGIVKQAVDKVEVGARVVLRYEKEEK